MKKLSCAVLLASLIILAIYLPILKAETYELKEYTVQKGDTLWDISGKEYKDSFQWPLIWKENPKIENPDLIYPGQVLKIPANLLQKEVSPAPIGNAPAPETAIAPTAPLENAPAPPAGTEIAPQPTDYVFSKEEMISCGFITDKVPEVGKIDSPVGYRELIATDDEVYLKLEKEVNPGDKFLAVTASKIDHPVTKKPLGYLVEPLGIVEVKEVKEDYIRGRVLRVYARMAAGNILIDFVEPESPLVLEAGARPEVEGYIVSLRDTRTIAGMIEFVYLDKGRSENLDVGDLVQSIKGRDPNAVIQIIRSENTTSTGLIRKNKREVNAADRFSGMPLD